MPQLEPTRARANHHLRPRDLATKLRKKGRQRGINQLSHVRRTLAQNLRLQTENHTTPRHPGVGAAKRLNALRWNVVARIMWAWVFTIPVSALIAYLLFRLIAATGNAGQPL